MVFLFKTLILGNNDEDKLSFMKKYAQSFSGDHYNTMGDEFGVVELEELKKTIKFQLHVISHERRFSEVRKVYYQGALGILIIFNDQATFDDAITWIEDVWKNGDRKKIPIVLFGNEIKKDDYQDPFEHLQLRILNDFGYDSFEFINGSIANNRRINDIFQYFNNWFQERTE